MLQASSFASFPSFCGLLDYSLFLHLHLKAHIHRLRCWRSGFLLPLHMLSDAGIAGGFQYLIGLVAIQIHPIVVIRDLLVSHFLKDCLIYHFSFLVSYDFLHYRVREASEDCWRRCCWCRGRYDPPSLRSLGQDWGRTPQPPSD